MFRSPERMWPIIGFYLQVAIGTMGLSWREYKRGVIRTSEVNRRRGSEIG